MGPLKNSLHDVLRICAITGRYARIKDGSRPLCYKEITFTFHKNLHSIVLNMEIRVVIKSDLAFENEAHLRSNLKHEGYKNLRVLNSEKERRLRRS